MRVLTSEQAREDLQEIYDYISADNPEAADRVLARIVEIIGLLAAGAFEGRTVRLSDGRAVQVWAARPYRIYYRVSNGALEVIRIYHQARRSIEK